MRPLGEAQSKAMRAYTQSGQYHTIVESRVGLTINAIKNDFNYFTATSKHALREL